MAGISEVEEEWVAVQTIEAGAGRPEDPTQVTDSHTLGNGHRPSATRVSAFRGG
jgi:hypothetical protein